MQLKSLLNNRMIPGALPRGAKTVGAKSWHLHLLQRLRMRGVINPFLQYVFMTWWLFKHRTRLQGVILSVEINLPFSVRFWSFIGYLTGLSLSQSDSQLSNNIWTRNRTGDVSWRISSLSLKLYFTALHKMDNCMSLILRIFGRRKRRAF
jgi:hypothetical protein